MSKSNRAGEWRLRFPEALAQDGVALGDGAVAGENVESLERSGAVIFAVDAAELGEVSVNDGAEAQAFGVVLFGVEAFREREFVFPGVARGVAVAHRVSGEAEIFERHGEIARGRRCAWIGFGEGDAKRGAFLKRAAGALEFARIERGGAEI